MTLISSASFGYPLAALLACLVAPLPALPQAVEIATGGIWIASGNTTSPVKACGVKAEIEGGTLLIYGRSDRPDTLRLALHKAAWAIPDLEVPVTISFAGGPIFHLRGRGSGADIRADIAAEDVRAFIHQFTADDDATLTLPKGREPPWRIDLHGTTPTIRGMAQCLETAQIWLPPPFSQPPGTAATGFPAEPASPVPSATAPATPRPWVDPDTVPQPNP